MRLIVELATCDGNNTNLRSCATGQYISWVLPERCVFQIIIAWVAKCNSVHLSQSFSHNLSSMIQDTVSSFSVSC
jgi:hypothetical protein